jgi:hypothetical protein
VIEVVGDLWAYHGRAVIAITTNGSITKDGRAVLGRGCARQAAERFPELPRRLGTLLREHGNHVYELGYGLVSFPVEDSAWALPDPALIVCSAIELRQLADCNSWGNIVVPRPGCGGGGLSWHDVRPKLASHLDDRFVLISSD